ncbi:MULTISPECIES: antibiotic biosynthesis monooxygenase family protein [unclassified Frigoribacterium]|jgi:quinol monooxygenase YgiN|uniref:putative quinol monooxygenase n=1 Tax=unclassified Frigoribacterium TaxID=2627005 RepID=UPI000F46FACF|nr:MULTISPECIES: antibiotic biosynthesis monooxygenase family protein [unclassified Frigoribacterium]ROP78599.1 antibiotic biosynthesis monooxygenase [Frigoribacterium sp. PhB107]TDT66390.1 antibiotic biosynthesis monooxygenase [Frigoribacterium sp. PhB116]
MIIVTGHLLVDPELRDDYLASCVSLVEAGRDAPGCLDYALSPDIVDPGRINVAERWVSQNALDDFRGSGPTDEQEAEIRHSDVHDYQLTGPEEPSLSESGDLV